MFFQKRRERKKAAAAEARQQILDHIQAEVDAANALPDIAERVIRFDNLSTEIYRAEQQARLTIKKRAAGKDLLPSLGVGAGTLGVSGIVLAHFAISATFLAPIAVPAAIGGIVAGNAVAKRAEKKAIKEAESFFQALNHTSRQISASIDQLIQDNLQSLASSPHFPSFIGRYSLCNTFMHATQEAAEKGAPASLPPPKTNGFQL